MLSAWQIQLLPILPPPYPNAFVPANRRACDEVPIRQDSRKQTQSPPRTCPARLLAEAGMGHGFSKHGPWPQILKHLAPSAQRRLFLLLFTRIAPFNSTIPAFYHRLKHPCLSLPSPAPFHSTSSNIDCSRQIRATAHADLRSLTSEPEPLCELTMCTNLPSSILY